MLDISLYYSCHSVLPMPDADPYVPKQCTHVLRSIARTHSLVLSRSRFVLRGTIVQSLQSLSDTKKQYKPSDKLVPPARPSTEWKVCRHSFVWERKNNENEGVRACASKQAVEIRFVLKFPENALEINRIIPGIVPTGFLWAVFFRLWIHVCHKDQPTKKYFHTFDAGKKMKEKCSVLGEHICQK